MAAQGRWRLDMRDHDVQAIARIIGEGGLAFFLELEAAEVAVVGNGGHGAGTGSFGMGSGARRRRSWSITKKGE